MTSLRVIRRVETRASPPRRGLQGEGLTTPRLKLWRIAPPTANIRTREAYPALSCMRQAAVTLGHAQVEKLRYFVRAQP